MGFMARPSSTVGPHPREPGSEEYLYSEKYQIHYHNLDRPDSLRKYIARVNHIRQEYAVLHSNRQPAVSSGR